MNVVIDCWGCPPEHPSRLTSWTFIVRASRPRPSSHLQDHCTFSIRWDDGRCCRDESRLTPLHQRRLHELIRTFEDIKNEKKFTCKVRKHQIDVAIIWGKSSTRGEIATTWPLWTIEEHFLMSSEADSEDVYDRALVEWESYSYNLPSFGDS